MQENSIQYPKYPKLQPEQCEAQTQNSSCFANCYTSYERSTMVRLMRAHSGPWPLALFAVHSIGFHSDFSKVHNERYQCYINFEHAKLICCAREMENNQKINNV